VRDANAEQDAMEPSVLIVGQQQILIVGVRHAVESDGLVVVGVASSSQEAEEVALATSPDLCLVLAPIPGGVRALLETLGSVVPGMLVVVMSSEDHLDGESLLAVVAAGAAGWLSLDLSPAVLGRTLRAVNEGEPGISRQHIGRMLNALRKPTGRTTRLLDGRVVELTPRERETLDLMADGHSTQRIAARLSLSAATVRWHIAHLVKKLKVESRAEAVALYRGPAGGRVRRRT
jgi:DNA-binding NarL/FixJ family response regulator